MCGIFCEICMQKTKPIKDTNLTQRIKNRGPDFDHGVNFVSEEHSLNFFASVLWMQGKLLVQQPVENDIGVLIYNGDVFDEEWSFDEGDTTVLMEKLTNRPKEQTLAEECIISTIKNIKGPFSVLYYDKVHNDLYFTRDRVGRSSLLVHMNGDSIVISSVLGRDYKCVELPATHIVKLSLNTRLIKTFEWNNNETTKRKIDEWINFLEIMQELPDDKHFVNYDENNPMTEEDHKIISVMNDTAMKANSKQEVMEQLLQNPIILSKVQKTLELLEKSVKLRLERQPQKCKNCLKNSQKCNHCAVAVLFSGGLDCTILAYLANKYVDEDQPIELINVAFKKDDTATYDVPDRLTGRQSFEELKQISPSRKWVFLEINVTASEVKQCQEKYIADLVYPRKTILDESLGTALWFASRAACGEVVSLSRVLLVGSGADELFGGYTRHRNAFKRHGWCGLEKELMLDWSRISFRNLARDNRVICDNGRQPRLPYLDEEFTSYVLKLKPWFRCFPSEVLGPGIGDKLTLRLVAYTLNLKEVALFPKRALQFGSRIANKKEKGSDISCNFIQRK